MANNRSTLESSNHSITFPKTNNVTADSCGKAIIVGEHAVIYGAEAVAMPLKNLRMKIKLQTSKQARNLILLGQKPLPEHVLGIIQDAFKVLAVEPFPVQIEGSSKLLVGSGLGSSAALSTVILKSLAKILEIDLKPQRLAEFARILESRFHGNSSGLDTSVVAYEQVIQFKNGISQPISIKPPKGFKSWTFVLIDSQTRSSTFAMVNQAAPFFTCKKAGKARIEQFSQLAKQVKTGLQEGNDLSVSSALNIASIYLAEAGLVSSLMKDMMSKITKMGVPACKLTGAGGGGCLLALLSPNSVPQQLEKLEACFGKSRVFSIEI